MIEEDCEEPNLDKQEIKFWNYKIVKTKLG